MFFGFQLTCGLMMVFYGYSVMKNPRVWGDQGRRAVKAENFPEYCRQNGLFFLKAGFVMALIGALDALVTLDAVLYLLLYFDASGFLRLGLLAAVLHELGHIAVYALLRRRLPVIEVTLTGFCMKTRGERFSPGQLFALAAAGPGVNFLLALLWTLRMAQRLTIRGGAFWAANLLTGCFNLLPIPPLDGAQLLECLRMLWRTSDRGWISRKPAGK